MARPRTPTTTPPGAQPPTERQRGKPKSAGSVGRIPQPRLGR